MSIKTIDGYFDEAKEDDVDFAVINRKEWEAVKREISAMREAMEFACAPDMWIEEGDLLSYQYVDWYVDILNAALEGENR